MVQEAFGSVVSMRRTVTLDYFIAFNKTDYCINMTDEVDWGNEPDTHNCNDHSITMVMSITGH